MTKSNERAEDLFVSKFAVLFDLLSVDLPISVRWLVQRRYTVAVVSLLSLQSPRAFLSDSLTEIKQVVISATCFRL